jgi:hypothetical protein
MKKCLLTISIIIAVYSCSLTKKFGPSNKHQIEPCIDTTFITYKPNLIVTTQQFLNGDSIEGLISKIEYFHDSILVKEIYRGHMTSEYEGLGDGDYQYFYDKNKKLKFKYFIDYRSGDTTKYCCEYFINNRDYKELEYDLRRRLKTGMPHGDIIEEKDLTKERIWLYNTTRIHFYNENNNLIELYEPTKESDITIQNKYTFKYQGNKLVEEDSYLNDTTLYWTEKFVYKTDEIILTHDNLNIEKGNKWLIPFYIKITKLNKQGNPTSIEEIDNNKTLMTRFLNFYDSNNRLIKIECFDKQNNLKVCHKIHYEKIE